ncbi:hypothetical protein KNCP2_01190 [Candidatus Rickettsia kedanie]|uniref:Uncharacterized protein n=1 Tax=Candidatus Rickettsia kedanie TaxID=3115352 RepID=A0ABP9TT22_9RICK
MTTDPHNNALREELHSNQGEAMIKKTIHAAIPSRKDRETKPCNNTELGMASTGFNNAISELE